jgi:NADP-dependent 3-hydroxy acid dehydrogenase YdfG
LVCVLIEAAGQAQIWLAPLPALALLGAAVTGFGYSLVSSVVLGARRADRLQSLAKELNSSGGKVFAVTTDVAQCRMAMRKKVQTDYDNFLLRL